MNTDAILGIDEAIGQIAKDVSIFAPDPIREAALLLAEGSDLVALILQAKTQGAPKDMLVLAITTAMKAASDAEMKKELGS